MPAEIKVRGDVVEITVAETWAREEAMRTQAEAARLLEELGLRRILVDCRCFPADAMKTLDTFELTSSHAARFPLGTRHAVVHRPDDQDATVVSFAQTVGANRGVNLQVFDDIERARAWLMA